MKYKVFIDQLKGQQFDLNVNEVAFMDLLIHLEGWADRYMIEEQLYYFISRTKVIAELPLFFKTDDTVYRYFRFLQEKEMILYIPERDFVHITPKGESWREGKKVKRSRKKITRLVRVAGKRGTFRVDNSRAYGDVLGFIEKDDPEEFEYWLSEYKGNIMDFRKFTESFNDTVTVEQLPYRSELIFERLYRYADNWLINQDRYGR